MDGGYRESAAEDRSMLIVAFEGQVFGVEARSGQLVWEQKVGMAGSVEVLIKDGRVYATTGYELHCLDYKTGARIGSVRVPDKYKGRASMIIEGDRIYIASNGEVTCFSLQGEPQWMQPFQNKGMGRVTLGFPGNLRQADDRGHK